jgi:uncharacterized protein (DUF885 family)
MTHRALGLAALLSTCALAACATVPAAAPAPVEPVAAAPVIAPTPPPPAATAESEHAKMFALFKASDEDQLRRNPIQGIFRGDMRYADTFGDYITDQYYAGEKAAAEHDVAALHTIDRSVLSPTDQIAYDTFEWETKDTLRGLQPDILSLTEVQPINHFFGLHTFYPTFASGQGAAPFKTLEDYENNLKRHKGFVTYLDRAIGRFKQGEASGVVETKLTVRNMIEQLNNQLKQKPEDSPYYKPVTDFPAGISAADQARLKTEYRAAITDELYPALTRLRDFLQNDYLAQAREGVGLKYMKGGDKLYRYEIESTTTEALDPAQVHQLGLDEVARITKEMDAIRQQVGFKGDLAHFFDYMRTAKRFQPKSRDDLKQGFLAVKAKVETKIPAYFSLVPKAPLVIRAYEPFREKFEAGGSYEQGTPDGSRPGTFYYNAYDLPSRATWEETTLFLHEGEPGHHFQISLAQENTALPNFMRFGGNTAYVEGWALYAESLGYQMGMYDDPYQRFGNLNDEMLRAMRLVVDTGIHDLGWTRDQSITYMLTHSGMSKTDATAEVERYIAIPSQALAYKVGALTIQRLRDKAQAELGDKFSYPEFHAEVLDTGALPLPVLEAKINAWIARKKAS